MVLVIAICVQINTIKASTANVGTTLRDNSGLRDELLNIQGKYQSLYQELENKEKVLVDFYADWCGPCKMIAPELERVESNIKVVKVDVDEFEELAREYGVMSIPTLILFDEGKEIKRTIGFIDKEKIEKFEFKEKYAFENYSNKQLWSNDNNFMRNLIQNYLYNGCFQNEIDYIITSQSYEYRIDKEIMETKEKTKYNSYIYSETEVKNDAEDKFSSFCYSKILDEERKVLNEQKHIYDADKKKNLTYLVKFITIKTLLLI